MRHNREQDLRLQSNSKHRPWWKVWTTSHYLPNDKKPFTIMNLFSPIISMPLW